MRRCQIDCINGRQAVGHCFLIPGSAKEISQKGDICKRGFWFWPLVVFSSPRPSDSRWLFILLSDLLIMSGHSDKWTAVIHVQDKLCQLWNVSINCLHWFQTLTSRAARDWNTTDIAVCFFLPHMVWSSSFLLWMAFRSGFVLMQNFI